MCNYRDLDVFIRVDKADTQKGWLQAINFEIKKNLNFSFLEKLMSSVEEYVLNQFQRCSVSCIYTQLYIPNYRIQNSW